MTALEDLTDLLARLAVEEADNDEPHPAAWHLARYLEAGDTEMAAATVVACRQARVPVTTELTPEVEAAVRRLSATVKAETFRALNQANHTNYPLPAWIRSELGATY